MSIILFYLARSHYNPLLPWFSVKQCFPRDLYDVIPSTTIYLFIRINSFSLISVLTYHLTKFKDTKRETKSRFLVGLYHGLERTTTYGNQGSDLGQAQTCGEVKPVNGVLIFPILYIESYLVLSKSNVPSISVRLSRVFDLSGQNKLTSTTNWPYSYFRLSRNTSDPGSR